MPAVNIHYYLPIAFLGLCAFLGNVFDLPVSFGVSFIFGSVFSVIAVAGYGLLPGIVVSLIGSSYTYHLWSHPYAIIVFLCEIVWIGYVLRRGRTNLFLADLSFWLLAGWPLVFLLYGKVMGLGLQHALIIALKQSVNGVLNTLLAWIVLSIPLIIDKIPFRFSRRTITCEQAIFQFAGMFLMVPSLITLVLFTQREIDKTQEEVTRYLRLESITAAGNLGNWVYLHKMAIQSVHTWVTDESGGLPVTPKLQGKLTQTHSLFPDFLTLSVGDDVSVAAVSELPNSQTRSITVLREQLEQTARSETANGDTSIGAEIFVSHRKGEQAVMSVLASQRQHGRLGYYSLGTISLDRALDIVQATAVRYGVSIYVVDEKDNILMKTEPEWQVEHGPASYAGQSEFVSDGKVILVVPGMTKNVSKMQAYRDGFYFVSIPVPHTSWHLRMLSPLAPLQLNHYQSATQGLAGIMILLILMAVTITYFSRWLKSPLLALTQVTADLPQKLEKQETISWPVCRIEEVARLTENFQFSAKSLAKSFAETRQSNAMLEGEVASRTRELQQERQRLAAVLNEKNIILENTPVGITMVKEREQVWHNRAAREMFGYTGGEFPRLSTRVFYRNQQEYDRVGREAYPKLARGESFHTDLIMVRKDGSEVEISLHGRAVNPELPQDGSIWIFEDISERKQLEEEREALIVELQAALKEVKTLGSMLPICSSCKKIRDDEGYWKQIEEYLGTHTGTKFSHGLCNECVERLYGNEDWYSRKGEE